MDASSICTKFMHTQTKFDTIMLLFWEQVLQNFSTFTSVFIWTNVTSGMFFFIIHDTYLKGTNFREFSLIYICNPLHVCKVATQSAISLYLNALLSIRRCQRRTSSYVILYQDVLQFLHIFFADFHTRLLFIVRTWGELIAKKVLK